MQRVSLALVRMGPNGLFACRYLPQYVNLAAFFAGLARFRRSMQPTKPR